VPVIKIGQYLAKIWTKVQWHVFLRLTVYILTVRSLRGGDGSKQKSANSDRSGHDDRRGIHPRHVTDVWVRSVRKVAATLSTEVFVLSRHWCSGLLSSVQLYVFCLNPSPVLHAVSFITFSAWPRWTRPSASRDARSGSAAAAIDYASRWRHDDVRDDVTSTITTAAAAPSAALWRRWCGAESTRLRQQQQQQPTHAAVGTTRRRLAANLGAECSSWIAGLNTFRASLTSSC